MNKKVPQKQFGGKKEEKAKEVIGPMVGGQRPPSASNRAMSGG